MTDSKNAQFFGSRLTCSLKELCIECEKVDDVNSVICSTHCFAYNTGSLRTTELVSEAKILSKDKNAKVNVHAIYTPNAENIYKPSQSQKVNSNKHRYTVYTKL